MIKKKKEESGGVKSHETEHLAGSRKRGTGLRDLGSASEKSTSEPERKALPLSDFVGRDN